MSAAAETTLENGALYVAIWNQRNAPPHWSLLYATGPVVGTLFHVVGSRRRLRKEAKVNPDVFLTGSLMVVLRLAPTGRISFDQLTQQFARTRVNTEAMFWDCESYVRDFMSLLRKSEFLEFDSIDAFVQEVEDEIEAYEDSGHEGGRPVVKLSSTCS